MLYTKSIAETRFTPIDQRTFGGEETGWYDNMRANYNLDLYMERIDSPYLTRSEVIKEYFDKLTALPGHEQALTDIKSKFNLELPSPIGNITYNPLDDPIAAGMKAPTVTPDMIGMNREMQGESYYEQFKQAITDYVERNTDVKEKLGEFTDERIQQLAIDKVQKLQLEQQDVYRRSTGLGVAGGFVGTMGALATDPVNIAAMVATRRPAVGWFKNAWREAIAAGISEGAIQKTTTEDWYKELGLEYTQEDFINRILFAGGAGFVFGGGAEFISEKLRKSIDKIERQRAELSGQPYEPNQDYEAMFNMFDIHNMVKSESPMEFDVGGLSHLQRENNAYTALITGDFSKLANNDVYIPRRYDNINHYDVRQPNTEMVDPSTLLQDPKRFQVKKKKIKIKAQAWDPVEAGTAVVYEFNNGTRYIVDGHGRVDLATNITKATGEKIQMPAIVLKQSYGITPEQAMVRAAGKNLAEGTITEADLKALYKRYNQPYVKLPTKKALTIQQMDELKALSNDVYQMITRGDVPAQYGMIVGRLIRDPDLQKAAMKALMLTDAKTLPQAESIVRQVQKKGLTTMAREMDETFGERALAIDLYKERAELLEKAIPIIANSNDYFTRVINKLNLTGLGKEQKYAKTIQLIYQQAHIKSGISDSLTRAAEAYAKSGRKNADQFARDFADDVLRNAEQRDFIRVSNGDNIIADAAAKERPSITEAIDTGLEEFSDELDLKGQRELSRVAEQTIRADDNLANQKITIDRLTDDGKLVSEEVTMKEALDEINGDEKSYKILEVCSRGTK